MEAVIYKYDDFFRFWEQNKKGTERFWTLFFFFLLFLKFISTTGVYFSDEDALRF